MLKDTWWWSVISLACFIIVNVYKCIVLKIVNAKTKTNFFQNIRIGKQHDFSTFGWCNTSWIKGILTTTYSYIFFLVRTYWIYFTLCKVAILFWKVKKKLLNRIFWTASKLCLSAKFIIIFCKSYIPPYNMQFRNIKDKKCIPDRNGKGWNNKTDKIFLSTGGHLSQ